MNIIVILAFVVMFVLLFIAVLTRAHVRVLQLHTAIDRTILN